MGKQYETVIGLEVHVELATKTKIFCSCSTEFGGAPNSHTCPVCTGMPGSLPVLNKKVVEYAIAVGLATNCDITQYCKFDRKNYFYPDNPQNYQISQLYLPICRNGGVEIETADGGKKVIGIHEIHMEEDAGKLIHDEWEDCSLVDFNRSGVPLIEIVSEPDMRSADEVIAYLEKLRMVTPGRSPVFAMPLPWSLLVKVLLPTLGTPTTIAFTVLRTPFAKARSTVSFAARSITARASFALPVAALYGAQSMPCARK